MPQATEELRAKWGGHEGVGIDKAVDFLKNAGYTLTTDWFWIAPFDNEIQKSRIPTDDELEAAAFLIQEWDFGTIQLKE